MFFDDLLTLSGKCFLVEFLGLFVVGNFTAKNIYGIAVKKCGMWDGGCGMGSWFADLQEGCADLS